MSADSNLHTYRFIFGETIEAKWLIKTLYQMVKRFMPGSFRCNRPLAFIIYIGNEFRGLHEGNVIRYRLRPEDLAGISRE